jgi:hypothetical protein
VASAGAVERARPDHSTKGGDAVATKKKAAKKSTKKK